MLIWKGPPGPFVLEHEPRSILVVRLSAIGDIVMASGMLSKLRQRFPGTRIDWLVQEECAPLLSHTPELDDLLIWPRRYWEDLLQGQGPVSGRTCVSGPLGAADRIRSLVMLGREIRNFIADLRFRQYDLVLDLQGLWKSAMWAWVSRSGLRIGLDSAEGSRLLIQHEVRSPAGDRRIASEYRTLLGRVFGLSDQDYTLGLGVSGADRSAALGLLQAIGLAPKRFVLFCPFTTRPQKHWPMENWLGLGKVLSRELGLPVLVLGGPGDRPEVQRWIKTADFPLYSLVGQTSLLQSLAVVQEASLVVGVDTGLTHMAVLSKVPAVALFGATCPYLDPGHVLARVLYRARTCSPCRRRPVCGNRFYCMQALSLELVKRECLELVG